MAQDPIQNVAIIGATGRIGVYLTKELLKTGKHTITVITRSDSKATPPAGVKVARVDYDDGISLATALEGQQFLAISLNRTAPAELHSRIVNAAAKAGVPYIMPNVYGNDIFNKKLREEDLIGTAALERSLEVERAGSSYIAMCSGFWYEHSLALGNRHFGIDVKNRKATLIDAGTTRINVSTWAQCGRAFAALLSLPESGTTPSVADWKNKPLYLSSFCISQREMLDSVERVTHTTDKDWSIRYEPSAQRYQDGVAELEKGEILGLVKAMYTRTLFPNGGGEFETKMGTANKALGLPQEDLDDSTMRAIEMVESGYGY